jgi:regulator of sigma E protease
MLVTILAFIVVLGITITVHEFGHFIVAKLLKIRVLVFSIGFGPRLVGFTRGGTEYRISPIPVGGYVKMAGETFDEERSGSPDEFLSHPKWHRFAVALAGPFMNVLLAVVILAFSYLQGVYAPRYLKEPSVVGPVAAGSIADRAGLKTGDVIVAVHGNPVETWEEMEIALGTAARNALDVTVRRGGQEIPLHFEAPRDESAQVIDPNALGFKFSIPRTIVMAVDPNSPAQQAGLREGDEILSVRTDGKTGSTYNQILNIISESKEAPLRLTVRRPNSAPKAGETWQAVLDDLSRGSTIRELTARPTADKTGRIVLGFFPEVPSDLQKFGVPRALLQSVRKNYEMSVLTFQILGRIVTGSASVKTLSGPIGIARESGSAARSGSARFFFGFIGIVSLNLGIFNLLPIPILDGGILALLLIESLIRQDISIRLKEKFVQVGFVFLILLMGLVVFNDLSKIVSFDKIFR